MLTAVDVVLMTFQINFSLKTFLTAVNGTTERFVVSMLALVRNSANKFYKRMSKEMLKFKLTSLRTD